MWDSIALQCSKHTNKTKQNYRCREGGENESISQNRKPAVLDDEGQEAPYEWHAREARVLHGAECPFGSWWWQGKRHETCRGTRGESSNRSTDQQSSVFPPVPCNRCSATSNNNELRSRVYGRIPLHGAPPPPARTINENVGQPYCLYTSSRNTRLKYCSQRL